MRLAPRRRPRFLPCVCRANCRFADSRLKRANRIFPGTPCASSSSANSLCPVMWPADLAFVSLTIHVRPGRNDNLIVYNDGRYREWHETCRRHDSPRSPRRQSSERSPRCRRESARALVGAAEAVEIRVQVEALRPLRAARAAPTQQSPEEEQAPVPDSIPPIPHWI